MTASVRLIRHRTRPPVVSAAYARQVNKQIRRLRAALVESREELVLYNGESSPSVRRIDAALKGETYVE